MFHDGGNDIAVAEEVSSEDYSKWTAEDAGLLPLTDLSLKEALTAFYLSAAEETFQEDYYDIVHYNRASFALEMMAALDREATDEIASFTAEKLIESKELVKNLRESPSLKALGEDASNLSDEALFWRRVVDNYIDEYKMSKSTIRRPSYNSKRAGRRRAK